MAEPIRVAVVEDDENQRALAVHTLRTAGDLQVMGSYATGREALAELRHADRRPDVVIVDLGLPDMSGTEVARELVAMQRGPEVVVLTAQSERALALEALKAGATGYLLKGKVADLPAAVRIAAAGGSAIAPEIARYLLDEVRVSRQAGDRHGVPLRDLERDASGSDDRAMAERPALTRREREVLALLAKGATYEDAARLLGISLGTVQSHVKSLYRKLEVSSKAEAAAEAVRRGIAWL